MNKKILIFMALAFMLVVPFVSADSLGTFKQNQEMQITNYCSDGTCTYMNLSSIILPNGTKINHNAAMTKNVQDFNYTYTPTLIGEYEFNTCGNPSGSVICDSDTFESTPSGFVGTLGFYILILILSLGIIILGFSLSDGWIVILGSFGFILLGLFILLYGIDGMKDTAYTYGIGIITIMAGSYIGIRSAIEQMAL